METAHEIISGRSWDAGNTGVFHDWSRCRLQAGQNGFQIVRAPLELMATRT